MTTHIPKELRELQESVWAGSLPIQVRLSPNDCRTYDQSDPYMIHFPRLSYLPLLLPRILAFFGPFLIDPDITVESAWLSFEGVPLKWHYPIGLTYDLFSGAQPAHAPHVPAHGEKDQTQMTSLPWKLTLHLSEFPEDQLVRLDTEGKVLQDAYINSVKEADFLRNGTAKAIMTLSKDDSTNLWAAVETSDIHSFSNIHNKLLPATASLRHIPIRFYLPSSPPTSNPSEYQNPAEEPVATAGHINVVQPLAPPKLPQTREPQTLGTSLHSALPSLFPSRRTPILAKPVLHGAVIPMSATLEDLMRSVAFMDGWLHFTVEMIG